MSDGIDVDLEELRAHANSLRALHDRFEAIRTASSHISISDDAYGELCQFLPPIMEERHQDQDEGMDALAENFDLLAKTLDECADNYEEADSLSSEDFTKLEAEF